MEGLKLDEKSTFKMPRLLFSSKLDWGSSIQFTAKIFSKKTGILICYIKFSLRGLHFIYLATIQLCMEYYCHVWAGALNYF